MNIRAGLAFSGLLILACAVAQQNEKAGKKRPDPFAPVSSKVWIMQVHSGIRSALEDLTSTDFKSMKVKDENGNIKTVKVPPTFGFTRVPMLSILHNGVIRDAKVPMYHQSQRYEVEYYGLSNRGKPLSDGELQMHRDFGFFANRVKPNRKQEIMAFGKKAVSSLFSADQVLGKIGDDDAQAMPLRATRKECIKCHGDSKVGDPLAIVVYVTKKLK